MTHPLRVLLVDDRDHVRLGLRLMLEEDGHEIEEADDGLDGVRIGLSWRPDVAVVDLDMPMVTGYDVAVRLRHALGDGIRLVALTGLDEREKCLGVGFDGFLLKPAEPEEVRRIVYGAA